MCRLLSITTNGYAFIHGGSGQRTGAGEGYWQDWEMADRLTYADLVILDELGYLLFRSLGGTLFHLLSALYEKASVIITIVLSFSEWASVFRDAKLTTALLIASPITLIF